MTFGVFWATWIFLLFGILWIVINQAFTPRTKQFVYSVWSCIYVHKYGMCGILTTWLCRFVKTYYSKRKRNLLSSATSQVFVCLCRWFEVLLHVSCEISCGLWYFRCCEIFVFEETVGTGYLLSLCVSKLRLLVFRASFACAHTFFRSYICVLCFVLLLGWLDGRTFRYTTAMWFIAKST